MYSTERNYINQIAGRLISALHIEIPIVSLEGVVSRLGGEIVENKALDDVHDGTIKKTGENSFEIVILILRNLEMTRKPYAFYVL